MPAMAVVSAMIFAAFNSFLIVPYGFNSSWLCHENKEKRFFRFNSSRLCREKNLMN
jgi:hypothetical protein